jgi:hypothetical protein
MKGKSQNTGNSGSDRQNAHTQIIFRHHTHGKVNECNDRRRQPIGPKHAVLRSLLFLLRILAISTKPQMPRAIGTGPKNNPWIDESVAFICATNALSKRREEIVRERRHKLADRRLIESNKAGANLYLGSQPALSRGIPRTACRLYCLYRYGMLALKTYASNGRRASVKRIYIYKIVSRCSRQQ